MCFHFFGDLPKKEERTNKWRFDFFLLSQHYMGLEIQNALHLTLSSDLSQTY